MLHTKVVMKVLGRGKKRLQHNIIGLSPGIPTQTNKALMEDGRKHTQKHTHTRTHTEERIHIIE